MLELRLLGQFDVRVGEASVTIPSRSAQSLLAYLALSPGTAHRRERLAGLLWPDLGEASARAALRQGLWRVRKALEARLPSGVHYLVADDLTVAFNPKCAYWLDAAALDAATSVEELQDALPGYRGELLPGFYDEWVLRERERLESVFERKISRLLDFLIAAQRSTRRAGVTFVMPSTRVPQHMRGRKGGVPLPGAPHPSACCARLVTRWKTGVQ